MNATAAPVRGDLTQEARAIVPFAVMCVGMFIALLDIQIVASSLQDIGGGLSAAQDQIGWVQTAYLIAEIIMIPCQAGSPGSSRRAGSLPPPRSASPWPACYAASPGACRA
jgi:hypothetical protein